MIFSVFQKNRVRGILGPPYYGIVATIRIGREMFCLPYAGFLIRVIIYQVSTGEPSTQAALLFLIIFFTLYRLLYNLMCKNIYSE